MIVDGIGDDVDRRLFVEIFYSLDWNLQDPGNLFQYRTTRVNEAVELIYTLDTGFSQKETGQAKEDFDLSCLVTRAGFKPTTACLEGRSSIQLSYRVDPVAAKGVSLSEPAAKIKKIRVDTKPWFYLPSAQPKQATRHQPWT